MSIYSTQFFAGAMPPNGTILYTVPPNMVVVVRDIEFYNGSGAAGDCSVGLRSSGGALLAVIFLAHSMAADTWSQWSGRTVLNGGELITSGAGATGFLGVVSGYLLTP